MKRAFLVLATLLLWAFSAHTQQQTNTKPLVITVNASHQAVLTWTGTTSTPISGYHVWRSTTSGFGYTQIGTVTGSGGGGTGNSYTTAFPATENPISQGGAWLSGHAAGNGCFTSPAFCFGDVQTTPGKAWGTVVSNLCSGVVGQNCNDSTAVLTGSWNKVQTAEGTIYTNGALNGEFSEVELRLLTTISANSITGYEITCSVSAGHYIGMARWNGPTGQFTSMGSNVNDCTNGDVMKATVDASGNFTVFKNGVVAFTAHDTTYTSGSPGVGFYTFSGNLSDFGLKNFTATSAGGGGNTFTFTDKTTIAGTTYYYVVTAFAPACPTTPFCGESGNSNQATATIPTP